MAKWTIPMVAQYRGVLEMLEMQLSASDLKMLSLHFTAPSRTLTASEMAIGMGYANYGAANLRYGGLARRICQALNISPKYRLSVLCTFVKPGNAQNEHWLWVMRPELAEALDQLGWFTSPS